MSADKNKGLLLGFLAGGVIGAVIALLYAPKSGRELRKDIKVKTDEYIEDAEKYINDAREKEDNGNCCTTISKGTEEAERNHSGRIHNTDRL